MIKNLRIKNYALIEELNIDFNKGMNIITGETGAGKSIILGSLELVMGKRADTSVLFDKDQNCIVELELNIGDYGLSDFFQENDIEYNDETIITRTINPSGKSRAFINDTPVNLATLNELTEQLVLIHKQFDNIKLNNSDYQLTILDNFADNKKLLKSYKESFLQFKKHKSELNSLLTMKNEFEKESEFIQYQYDELKFANLNKEEFENDLALYNNLNNAESIKNTLMTSYNTLTEIENSILEQLQELANMLNQLEIIDQNFSQSREQFLQSIENLTDVANTHLRIAESTDFDEEKILLLGNRIDTINNLMIKYKVNDIDDLIEKYNAIAVKLEKHFDVDDQINKLKLIVNDNENELNNLCETLRKTRLKAAEEFSKLIAENLNELALPHSKLKIQVLDITEFSETGKNAVNFLFSANKGSDYKLMKDVASGGELSRLALSIESAIAGKMSLPTLVFDEIEAGISGEIARKMGAILKTISQNHQLINITHSPQIAAEADHHYFVYKNIQENKTFTNISLLTDEERIIELAKMLSGDPPSHGAIENAKELINKN